LQALRELVPSGIQVALQAGDVAAHVGKQLIRIRPGVGRAVAQAHGASEIDQQRVHAAAAHFDAHRKRAIGVQRNGHRGLAHAAAAHGGLLAHQVFGQ